MNDISMHVCMYVCMYVRTYVRMYVCMYVRTPHINGEVIERVNNFKLLGVWFQNNLKWNTHTETVISKANRLLYHQRECRKSYLPTEVDLTLYKSKIRPIIGYASPVWGGLSRCLENEIKRLQRRSLRILGLESGN